MFNVYFIIELNRLYRQARRRRRHAFRPGTNKNHICQFKKYIGFCKKFNLRFLEPSIQTICLYIEQLAQNFSSRKSLGNYVSAIKLLHKFADKQCEAAESFEVGLMLRAASLTMRGIPNQRLPLNVDQLKILVNKCTAMGAAGQVIKMAFILGFMAYLRASNLCPENSGDIDPTRCLLRGDVRIEQPGLIMNIKWSKTMQSASQPLCIAIPALNNKKLDPVFNLKVLRATVPAPPEAPFFILPNGQSLTIRTLRNTFTRFIREMGLSTKHYSLHSLRRGGASVSLKNCASYMDIKRHGSWNSEAFWAYLTRLVPEESTVVTALQSAMQ